MAVKQESLNALPGTSEIANGDFIAGADSSEDELFLHLFFKL